MVYLVLMVGSNVWEKPNTIVHSVELRKERKQ